MLGVGMRFAVDHVLPVIVATAVLHNRARLAADDLTPDDPLLDIRWDVIQNEDLRNRGDMPVDDKNARQYIIAYF